MKTTKDVFQSPAPSNRIRVTPQWNTGSLNPATQSRVIRDVFTELLTDCSPCVGVM